ncbi:MAG: hypothetical protein JO319_17930, partial [Acidobacteriaceae bacterium]|nr:hypothetical protein [Acidobacteriaceae bacterium]
MSCLYRRPAAGCRRACQFAYCTAALLASLAFPAAARSQAFFPLEDVHPGLRGVGRTVFQGNRVEEFQVEILGVLQNLTPKQTVILARLSGGPLSQTGVVQGMSGSPVYIDGKLLGAVALGFPFSKEPIAGIQPIESMITESNLHIETPPAERGISKRISTLMPRLVRSGAVFDALPPIEVSSPFGNLTQILTPLSFSGFTPATLKAFAPDFRSLGFEAIQGVSAGSQNSPGASRGILPGSMISVGLLTGDMNITADGTVTYVAGNRIYAFGHRFLDTGTTELPFAHSEVVAVIPSLNSSFKVCAPHSWVGTILSDRATAVSGEIGRSAHTIPLSVSVRSAVTGTHDYHFQIVNDRFLTPFITQTALFSVIDATERTLGAGTLRLTGQIDFDGASLPLNVRDMFVSDSGLAQQVASDAVVTLAFVLGGGYRSLHPKGMSFVLEPIEGKRQLRIAQAWASTHEVRPGSPLQITVVLQGENGQQFTKSASYQVPVGAALGPLNVTVSDANTLNFPDFAGLSQSALQTPEQLIDAINHFRDSNNVYFRLWRQQPTFNVA